ncbi:hypothetical protein lerEdw1_010896 [Lerista edwardsae]|nr:hypothetical protein lerEdw1_010896 [Lerista edwardsae]
MKCFTGSVWFLGQDHWAMTQQSPRAQGVLGALAVGLPCRAFSQRPPGATAWKWMLAAQGRKCPGIAQEERGPQLPLDWRSLLSKG